jgi:hypothetical protein
MSLSTNSPAAGASGIVARRGPLVAPAPSATVLSAPGARAYANLTREYPRKVTLVGETTSGRNVTHYCVAFP